MSKPSIRNAATATLLCLSFAASLTGCAARPRAVTVTLPPSVREPCRGADAAGVVSVQDIAAFALQEEAAVQACEAKRAAAVATVDGA